jgi:hypothetical protein
MHVLSFKLIAFHPQLLLTPRICHSEPSEANMQNLHPSYADFLLVVLGNMITLASWPSGIDPRFGFQSSRL